MKSLLPRLSIAVLFAAFGLNAEQALAQDDSDAPAAAGGLELHSAFGFDIALTDDGWRRATAGDVGLPAEFAAIYSTPDHPSAGTLAIIPIFLPDGVEARSVIEPWLARVYARWGDLQTWEGDDFTGYWSRATQTDAETGRSVLHESRIIVEPQAAYLVFTTAADDAPEALDAVDAARDTIHFSHGATLDALSPAEGERYGQTLNDTGAMLAQQGRVADAAALFRVAVRYLDDPGTLKNLAAATYGLRQYKDVVAIASEYLSANGDDLDVLHWRADSHARLGQLDDAIDDYAKAIELDADEQTVANYVNVLVAAGRAKEAGSFLDKFSRDHDTVQVNTLMINVANTLGDDKRFKRAADFLTDPKKSNAAGALAVAALVAQKGDYFDLQLTSQQIIDAGLDSAELYALVASFEIRFGRYTNARRTIDAGLARFRGNASLANIDRQLEAVE